MLRGRFSKRRVYRVDYASYFVESDLSKDGSKVLYDILRHNKDADKKKVIENLCLIEHFTL